MKETKYKQTEIGIIPEEWEVVKLGDVAEINSGGNAPQGEEYFIEGKYPFVRVQHFDGTKNYVDKWDLINEKAVRDYKLKLFPKNSIVFPKSGASIRLEKRAMLSIEAYVVSHLCVVNSYPDRADNLFLFYLLKKIKFTKQSGGTTLPYLNLKNISTKLIPLPPLPEQKKIAYVLSVIQEAKERTEAVIKATKGLKKSLMKYLFTYGPVPLDEAENVKLKETEIGLIPEDWEVVKLGELNIENKKTINPAEYPDELFEYYSIPAYQENRKPIIEKGCNIRSQKILLKNGTVLFGKLNPRVEKVWMVLSKNNLRKIGSTEWLPIYPDTEKVTPKFLYYAEWSKYVMQMAKTLVSGSTPSRQRVDPQSFYEIKIPLPSIPIQQKIASILFAVDEKIEREENKKKALEELFKSMLHNLMTGKVRVKDLDIKVDENVGK